MTSHYEYAEKLCASYITKKRHTLNNKFIFMVGLTFSDRSENFKVEPNLRKVCKYTKKLRGLSPRANYTDRAAAAGQRS